MSSLVLATGFALLVAAGGDGLFRRVAPAPWVVEARPAKGSLLVAERRLPDPNFARSVVLLLAYGDGGAMGIIVDRPTRVRLATVLPEIDALRERPDTVWVGGPVLRDALLVLVRERTPPKGGERIFDDVHLFASRDAVRRVLARGVPRERLRAFAGHAGWAPGQLDAEIARGDWLVVPAAADLVFSAEPDAVWPRLIERAERIMTHAPRRPGGTRHDPS